MEAKPFSAERLSEVGKAEKNEKLNLGKWLTNRVKRGFADILDVFNNEKTLTNVIEKISTSGHAAEEFSKINSLIPDALRKLEMDDIPKMTGRVERTGSDDHYIEEHLNLDSLTEDGELRILESIADIKDFDQNKEKISTELRVVDQEKGVVLNLNALLPPGYTYTHSSLEEIVREGEGNKARLVKEGGIPLDKYRYYGKSGKFSFVPLMEKVYYGNLQKPEGILSLLHEIGHVWQSKNRERPYSNKVEFEELSGEIRDSLGSIVMLTKRLETEKLDQETRFFLSNLVDDGLKRMEELGTSVSPEIHGSEVKSTALQKYNLKVKAGLRRFERLDDPLVAVRNEKLERSLLIYEASERDAWANALRIMRRLRELDFDIAPSLNTLESVRETIQQCLSSYEESVGITFSHRRTPFTRKPKSPRADSPK